MPATKTATLTYIEQQVPGDQPIPDTWYAGVRTVPDGQPVGAEQAFPTPVDTIVFTDLAPGTYEVWAGQRAAGAPYGDVVKSPPFTAVADVTIKIVATITIS